MPVLLPGRRGPRSRAVPASSTRRASARAPALLAALLACATVRADPTACAAIDDDARRLACYDRSVGRDAPGRGGQDARRAAPRGESVPPGADAAPTAPTAPAAFASTAPNPSAASDPALVPDGFTGDGSLADLWELEPRYRRGVFRLRPHRPLYALVNATSAINDAPSSPSPGHQSDRIADLRRAELKLQISFKAKAWENILGTPADLWLAYTQLSYWQALNSRISSPFRSTDYEPAALVVAPLSLRAGPVAVRMAGLGVVHQSNGQALPYSRSWNRIEGLLGLEACGWSIVLRPWWRLRERPEEDDNPGIENYVGRGELLARRRFGGGRTLTVAARHSLRGGDHARGSLRLDWSTPLAGGLAAHVQVFHGWGASLLDYNFRQTTVGLGLSIGH